MDGWIDRWIDGQKRSSQASIPSSSSKPYRMESQMAKRLADDSVVQCSAEAQYDMRKND